MVDLPPSDEPVPSARALLKERDYLLFWGTRWFGSFASQIQSVAMGWQMYALARLERSVEESALMVGMIGLAAFVPVFLLTLPAGEAADRYDRKKVLLLCLSGEITSVLILAIATVNGYASPALLLVIAALFGASRAFFAPANTALGPMLVPRKLLPRAIAWNSLAWQTASICGPAAAGFLVARSAETAYFTTFALYGLSAVLVASIRSNAKPEVMPGSRWQLVKEGLAYVWRQKIVFGAISLDLFAVLLGGATALLPVFARDVLHVGAEGFGLLRAGPAIGATAVALWLAANPIRAKAGLFMFGGVAVFGLATIVFGISRSLWLSVAALAVLGGADMLSVFVRQTLVQLVTPDHMRGRVASVSSVFIGASNELGEFESGVVARILGPVGAAIFGGVGAVMVTGIWAKLFPDLRRADRLE
ncbi:MAG: MFS transporter [Alphaproteobacteria bacterium]|nr:MFS transporter [Alphaproteobacteria bacterium]MBU1515728.1 MFS transporter [Alphaproteobacteria bacterium]MBU2097011.1 MFS transporter [Alphaproteobacteria bacterium]MBU2149527.1 MFS transporter [Alphaproteobacteria bacterium]MBU2308913.1 MFS transporter [Alphaproteobacteria bacterium]